MSQAAWHEGLDFAGNTGDAGCCAMELPASQGRLRDPMPDGRHPLEAMLSTVWRMGTQKQELARLRAVCSNLWDFSNIGTVDSQAVMSFAKKEGAQAAVWLASRTAPGAFVEAARIGSEGVEALSAPRVALAESCVNGIANDMWSLEGEAAKKAWTALMAELASWAAEELGGGVLGWKSCEAIGAKMVEARLARFEALDEKDRTEWIQSGSAEACRDAAESRNRLRGGMLESDAHRYAGLWCLLSWGPGHSLDKELKGSLRASLGMEEAPPAGWASHAAAHLKSLSSEAIETALGRIGDQWSKALDASGETDWADAIAFLMSERLEADSLGHLARAWSIAKGRATESCPWNLVFEKMSKKAGAALALRSSPLARSWMASACVGLDDFEWDEEPGSGSSAGPSALGGRIGQAWISRTRSLGFGSGEAGVHMGLSGCSEVFGGRHAEALSAPCARGAVGEGAESKVEESATPASEKESLAPGGLVLEELALWTPEAWKHFKEEVEAVDNKDAFASARSLIKKVSTGKLGSARRMASAASLEARLDWLAARFPHFETMVERLGEFCKLARAGDGALWFPPLLMVGGAGIGKTYFSSMVADLAGSRLEVVDMGAATAGWLLTGLTDSYSTGRPGMVSRALVNGELGNPLMLLDEIDKANGDSRYQMTGALLPLLEPHSARRFADECVPLEIDASRICWLATANDASRMSAPLLSRFDVFQLPNPTFPERRSMCAGIYEAVSGSYSWGKSLAGELPAATLDRLAGLAAEGAARDLRRALTSGCAKAVAAGRKEVWPEDLPAPLESERDPWDAPLGKDAFEASA
jgi:ATP-dependent Lon protease